MHVVERFAAWAVDFRNAVPPQDVLHHARRAVIDWHAALLPGTVVPPATLLKEALKDEISTPRTAALINGTAAHTMEVDDIFREGIYHPGAPTIAAAHALGFERRNFLRSVIVGYEISTRIGAAMGRAHYKYWHNTGTIGCFGASAGLQQAFRMDSMSKPLHAGRAAEAGVTAALMAAQGVTGSLDVLEGDAGYGKAMGGDPDWEKALATLGREFHITRMTFKNHACCGHTFAAIDGVLELKERMRFEASDIEHVDVATYRAGVEVAHYENPQTPVEGRFSLKYVVAAALTHGNVRLAAFTPERMRDATTRSLLPKISVSIDPQLDAAFPAQRAARVAIRTRDGRREEWLQPTRVGDPDAPLSDAQLESKFLELAVPVLGEAKAKEKLAQLWALGTE